MSPGVDRQLLAHGIGTRSDLPIPFTWALIGAGAAVVISFAALGVLWPRSRFRGDAAGRPMPRPFGAVLDSSPVRVLARAAVLLASTVVLCLAWLGPPEINFNVAPWMLYVVFWVGLVPVSALLGPVWRAVNPLRILHAGWFRLRGMRPDVGLRQLPDWVGVWPAALSVLLFAGLELVHPQRQDPRTVGLFLSLYAGMHLLAALVYGSRWFAAADGFEAYSTLVGRRSPLGRGPSGGWVLRSPLDTLDGLTPVPGTAAACCVLLGVRPPTTD